MFCAHCGAANPDQATVCSACGEPLLMAAANPYRAGQAPPSGSGVRRVPNYLIPSILATLFCCLPFGIVAIIYAAQVDSKLSAGDLAGAQRASDSAKMWCWVAFALGLIVSVLYFGMISVAGFGNAGNAQFGR